MSAEWFKIAFGELYPLVYAHRDVAEAARVAHLLAPIVGLSRPVLDVACGDGRYMSALIASSGVCTPPLHANDISVCGERIDSHRNRSSNSCDVDSSTFGTTSRFSRSISG